MSTPTIPPGYTGQFWFAPGIEQIIKLLNLIAGDPTQTEKALFYEQGTVSDTVVSRINRVASATESYSILMVQFSESSGRGRYQLTGAVPQASGIGMPILSGGTLLIIRGVDNINNFQMISETGQSMQYNALLFKAQAFMSAIAR